MEPRRVVRLAAAAVSILVLRGATNVALAATESSVLFKTKCSSCHTVGSGDRVGPDLKGVTVRRPRRWLLAWIRSSETLIRKGDRDAQALFRQYRQQRMPDHDLSDEQITALLDYFDTAGSAAPEKPRMRLAIDGSSQDIRLGRQLFFGEARFTSGAVACVFCHALRRQTFLGGSFAPDLSGAYTRYFDQALDQLLRVPCVSRAASPSAPRVLDAESLALRSFLRSVNTAPSADASTHSAAADDRNRAPR